MTFHLDWLKIGRATRGTPRRFRTGRGRIFAIALMGSMAVLQSGCQSGSLSNCRMFSPCGFLARTTNRILHRDKGCCGSTAVSDGVVDYGRRRASCHLPRAPSHPTHRVDRSEQHPRLCRRRRSIILRTSRKYRRPNRSHCPAVAGRLRARARGPRTPVILPAATARPWRCEPVATRGAWRPRRLIRPRGRFRRPPVPQRPSRPAPITTYSIICRRWTCRAR